MSRKLTPKQKRFIEEYMIDLNATQAAIRAGYSEKTAYSAGQRLLKQVEDEINTALAERSARTQVTADRVLKELAKIAYADPRAVLSWGPGGVSLRDSSELTDDEAAIVAEVSETGRVKLFDRVKALELLGRHLGLFVERREVSGPDGSAVKAEITGGPCAKIDLSGLSDDELQKLEEITGKISIG
jgi:phage terminase small subunit